MHKFSVVLTLRRQCCYKNKHGQVVILKLSVIVVRSFLRRGLSGLRTKLKLAEPTMKAMIRVAKHFELTAGKVYFPVKFHDALCKRVKYPTIF